MSGILGDVVMPTITKSFGISLGQCIRDAESQARSIVASGEYIRWAHNQGCANNSIPSTESGTISIANKMIESTLQYEDDDEFFFGNNLRRAWRAIKPLFRKAQ